MFLANIPLNIDWQQILLHVLNLVILVGGLYLLLYKPVKNFMAKRKEYYEQMDKKSNDNLENSEAIKKEINERLKNLNAEISQKKTTVNKEIEDYRNTELAKASKEAEDIVKKAMADGNLEKERILASANEEIKNLVCEATEKLVLDSTASDAYDQFLDKALKGSDKDEW